MVTPARIIRKIKDFVVYHIIGIDDTPHNIALGVAVGTFIAWTPTIPFQMALTFLICGLLGANKLVGQPVVWVTNPVTAIPIYWLNFEVGCLFVPGEYSSERFISVLYRVVGTQVEWGERVALSWQATQEFFIPLWVGSICVGTILATAGYLLSFSAAAAYRKRRGYPAKSKVSLGQQASQM